MSGEYSTGTIRSTLMAVPKRLPVLRAKVAVYAAVSYLLMVPAVLIAFFASQSILRGHHILQLSFSDPGVERALFGGALYVTLVGIFALALGALVRHTAGGISAFVGTFFVLRQLATLLPTRWDNAITKYLPSDAGQQLYALHHEAHSLSPLQGGLVSGAYCLVAVAAPAVLLMRRDA
jgi:ABC-2 type transport system permease protein